MHIEHDYDQAHTKILLEIQHQLQKPLPEVLDQVLEMAKEQLASKSLGHQPTQDGEYVNPAFKAFLESGLIGCLKGDGNLSVNYKDHLWTDKK